MISLAGYVCSMNARSYEKESFYEALIGKPGCVLMHIGKDTSPPL